jgi:hypothetical protein
LIVAQDVELHEAALKACAEIRSTMVVDGGMRFVDLLKGDEKM